MATKISLTPKLLSINFHKKIISLQAEPEKSTIIAHAGSRLY